jgi:hypothetical protein
VRPEPAVPSRHGKETRSWIPQVKILRPLRGSPVRRGTAG